MENKSSPQVPRVLIFPFPAQGPINATLKLAELLALAGLHVTFLNSEHVHNRLIRCSGAEARLSRYPGFLFGTIRDGVSPGSARSSGVGFMAMVRSVSDTMKPLLRGMLVSGELGSVTCVLAEGLFGGWTVDVAEELGIPIVHFRTISASFFWSFFFFPKLIETGELPIRGREDMDRLIQSVPGMENLLRCRDLPRYSGADDLYLHSQQANDSIRARGLILNTFEDLEGPIVSHIKTKCPNTYTIGPLHAHLKARLASNNHSLGSHSLDTTTTTATSTTSLFDVDRSCMAWLDSQPPKSVIYASFGSIVVMTKDEVMEFWYGLVNTKKRFLWAIRPDLVDQEGGKAWVPHELLEATRERGLMVGWVPQEEVLSHPAVGGFLTHSGWNSTLECIVAEVPMICWPYFADQQINSRYVGEVWKLGIDMKDVCDRKVVEKMVNDLMDDRRDEFARSTAEMAKLARESVSEGGSSYRELDRLVDDIRLMSNGMAARKL